MSVEILVHNVSHSDLVLALNNKHQSLEYGKIIGKPKFSHFKRITQKIDKSLGEIGSKIDIEMREKHKRLEGNGIQKLEDKTFLGIDLRKIPIDIVDTSALKFRRNVRSQLPADNEGCVVTAAYFPLLAILVPKWLATIEAHGQEIKRKIIFLVTGRGTPVDITASEISNSTKHTGALMTRVLNNVYPDIQIIRVHSKSNLFRYDDNIRFVHDDLLPKIDVIRNDLAYKFAAKWRDMLRVSLSFADGSSARVSAISASLRHYR